MHQISVIHQHPIVKDPPAPGALAFPIFIPGYGQIPDLAAWEIFKKHYRGMAATLAGRIDPAIEEADPEALSFLRKRSIE